MDLKVEARLLLAKLQAYGFWIVLLILLGFWFGVQYGKTAASDRFSEATQLGGMIYNGKVYDVKERQIQ